MAASAAAQRAPGTPRGLAVLAVALGVLARAPLSSAGDVLQRSATARERYDHTFKVVVAGDSGVGKSSIILRYADNTFNPSYTATIGVDFKIRTLDLDGKRCKLQIWDTAGQDRFRSIVSNYYRGAHGVILVYAVDSAESFEHVPDWLDEVRGHAPEDAAIALFGNKCDVPEAQRQVPLDTALGLCADHRMAHHQTSAKAGLGVEDAFLAVAREMKAKAPLRQQGAAEGPRTFSMEPGTRGAKATPKCCANLF